MDASLNSRWASSKKNTSLGLSMSPTSGSSLNRSASSHIKKVENKAGRLCRFGSSSSEMTPRPSGMTRIRSAVSNSGSPKNSSAPCCWSSTSLRRITPTVALETPPRLVSSSLPSSLVRY
ncbi:Uncharacterised protein [Mycobacteroides abscessus subsp. abscessus]|nr:Uncharacterised protein [Mycobacteroides abscessus subsp. abscessus]